MRLPYLQVCQETWALSRMLAGIVKGLNRREAFGLICDFWSWGLELGPPDQPPQGILNSPRAAQIMAGALEWTGDATEMVNALSDIGLLEITATGIRVRGLSRYREAFEKAETNRERMRIDRAVKKLAKTLEKDGLDWAEAMKRARVKVTANENVHRTTNERASNVQRTNSERSEHEPGTTEERAENVHGTFVHVQPKTQTQTQTHIEASFCGDTDAPAEPEKVTKPGARHFKALAKTNPRHTPMVAKLAEVFLAVRGVPISFEEKDFKALQRLLVREPSDEEILRRWGIALAMPSGWTRCSSIAELHHKWNSLAGITAPGAPKPKPAPVPKPIPQSERYPLATPRPAKFTG